MQRFFVEPHQIDEAAHQIHIIGTDVNHISNVLRMKQGEEVWISDGGQKEYRCAIEAFSADEVLLHINQIMNCRAESTSFRDCQKQIRWN